MMYYTEKKVQADGKEKITKFAWITNITITKSNAKKIDAVSLLASTLYFLLSPISYASTEIITRTSPTIWDVVIAFVGGLAGIIGARKKEANNIVPGVAIATALMPPVCTVGYSIATGNLEYMVVASYLFSIDRKSVV